MKASLYVQIAILRMSQLLRFFTAGMCSMHYKRDDKQMNGDFSVKWRSTDPWRGYYEVKSKKYALVNTAELLAWHESEKTLKEFDRRIRELFDEHDVEYARVFARSSNVFYQNYELYVKKEQELIGRLLVVKAMFPERKIETDYDAAKLIEELGDDTLTELQIRLKLKGYGNEYQCKSDDESGTRFLLGWAPSS